MIQEKELRSGNWLYDICGTPSKYSFEWHKHYFDIDYKDIFDNINPIPITPEILEKCGFEKGYDTKLPYSTSYHIPNNSPVDEVIFMADDEDNYFLSNTGDDGSIVQLIGKPFKFLHQLQNLYYSLTGEELNIEL